MIDTADTARRRAHARRGPGMDRRTLTRAAVIVVLLLLALFALPPIMSAYYTDTMIQVAIYSIVTLGLGLLVGRVGLYSLGQLAVLTIGAWVGARLLFATGQPYILVLIEAGLVTMIIGSLITLPALRLRGLYLALITLMLAGGVTVILATLNFPNGGGGFSGYNGSLLHIPQIRRPSFAGTDPAFYRFSVIVAIVMFLLVFAHLRARPGRAWAAIKQSEPSALAAGINTTFYKLWAMALAAFVTGRRRRAAGRRGPRAVLDRLPDPELDRAARRRAHGRRVRPDRRGDRRVPAVVPARAAADLGRAERLADHLVRRRRHAGARHRARRHRRPVPQGHEAAVRLRSAAACGAGAAAHALASAGKGGDTA